MRLTAAIIMAFVFVSLAGCPRSTSESSIESPSNLDAAPPETIVETDEDETQYTDGPAGELVDEVPDFGLYSDPGDLPHYNLIGNLDDDDRYLAYADMDGDGVREALLLGRPAKKEGADWEPAAELHIGKWDATEEEWTIWYRVPARGDEHQYDEDSIGFVYDMDGDGAVEFAVQYHKHPPAADDEDALVGRFYVYRLYESGPDIAVPESNRDHLSGALTVLFVPEDELYIGDTLDEYPGDELIVSSPRKYRGEEAPYMWSVEVYGWVDGDLRILLDYETDNRYNNGDEAYEAWVNDEGDYQLVVDYTDDEE